MSRLTELARASFFDARRVGPHHFRRLGERILIADDFGRFSFMTAQEAQGISRDDFDFDAAAERLLAQSLLSWPGPETHILRLSSGGRLMSVETARQAVDFAFRAPGSDLNFEMVADPLGPVWGLVWFVTQYARRKSEWHGRGLTLTLRVQAAPSKEQARFLDGHKVELRTAMVLRGRQELARIFSRVRRVAATVEASASQAAVWVDRLAKAGVKSVLLLPALPEEVEQEAFFGFYAAAIDRMLQLDGRFDIREERALGLLSGQSWRLPGHDLLAELLYLPDGGIYSSEQAYDLGGEGRGLLRLGEVASTRYEDLAMRPAVQAVMAASLPENQPLCSQCVYRAFCSIAPSQSLRSQGTLWGQHPSSAACALHMGIMDILFSRLAREESAIVMRRWARLK